MSSRYRRVPARRIGPVGASGRGRGPRSAGRAGAGPGPGVGAGARVGRGRADGAGGLDPPSDAGGTAAFRRWDRAGRAARRRRGHDRPVGIITGASKGLGRALAGALAGRGWDLVLDARDPVPLAEAAGEVSAHGTRVTALPGDVTDAGHRGELVAAARRLGGADLLVHNASALGAQPLVRLEELPLEGLRRALEVNLVAALGLAQEA